MAIKRLTWKFLQNLGEKACDETVLLEKLKEVGFQL